MFLDCGWKCTKATTKSQSLPWNICTFADISCCGMLQDRPSTKVQAAPGGDSSLGYLFSGSKDGKWCTPAVSVRHDHGRRFLLNKGKREKKLVFPWVNIKLLMVSVLLGLLVCVYMFVCVVCWSTATGSKSFYPCWWNCAQCQCWHYRGWFYYVVVYYWICLLFNTHCCRKKTSKVLFNFRVSCSISKGWFAPNIFHAMELWVDILVV